MFLAKGSRRRVWRKRSKQRSLIIVFLQWNWTISTFWPRFLKSTMSTSFKLQIVGITHWRCRFHLQCKLFLTHLWHILTIYLGQVREMCVTLNTSWNMKVWWKNCWKGGQQGQLWSLLIWRILIVLQRRYVFLISEVTKIANCITEE